VANVAAESFLPWPSSFA